MQHIIIHPMEGMTKRKIRLSWTNLSIEIRFFTYGSFPLADTLAYLNEHLQKYKQQKTKENSSTLTEETHWNKPRSVKITCSPQSFVVDPTKTTTVSVSYLLGRYGSLHSIYKTISHRFYSLVFAIHGKHFSWTLSVHYLLTRKNRLFIRNWSFLISVQTIHLTPGTYAKNLSVPEAHTHVES